MSPKDKGKFKHTYEVLTELHLLMITDISQTESIQ